MTVEARTPRSLADVRRTPRSAWRSLWRTHTPQPPPRGAMQFLTKRIWPWLVHYLSVLLRPRHSFPTYGPEASPRPGVFPLPDKCLVALAGDWGTGTDSAYRVAKRIRALHPDVTIHLGDVYYSGTEREYRDYFLGEEDWPRGAVGTYALNGNHEMYSGGTGYFDAALKSLRQKTSYFCLESPAWRIVAVDTGYYARSVPFLELLLTGCIRLPSPNRRWLRDVVFADPADRRPVVLLSHHQWFSAFESEYRRVGKNLAPYLDRVVLWLWGHEHRFAGYAPFGRGRAPRVRARCIGHGGMPVELRHRSPRTDRNLVFSDERRARFVDGDPIGYCGFALLRLDGPDLRLTYVDEMGTNLLEEQWVARPDGASGTVAFVSPDLTIAASQTIAALVAG